MIVGSLLASTSSVEYISSSTVGTTGSRCARIAVSDTGQTGSTIGVIFGLADRAASRVAGDAVIDIAVSAFVVDEEGTNRTLTGQSGTIIILSIQTCDEFTLGAGCIREVVSNIAGHTYERVAAITLEAICYTTRVRSDACVDATGNDKVETRLAGRAHCCAGAFQAVGHSLATEAASSRWGEIVKIVTFRANDRTIGGDGAGGAIGAGGFTG